MKLALQLFHLLRDAGVVSKKKNLGPSKLQLQSIDLRTIFNNKLLVATTVATTKLKLREEIEGMRELSEVLQPISIYKT